MTTDTFADALFSGAIGSVVGGIIGALIPFIISNHREKRAFTINLISQFDSHSMYMTRSRAWNLIKKYPTIKYDSIEIYNTSDADDIWALTGFFRLIGILLKENRVDKRLIVDGVGQAFIWWYYASFKDQLLPVGSRWDFIQNINYIHDWLQTEVDKSTFDRWAGEGKSSRDTIIPPPKTEPSKINI